MDGIFGINVCWMIDSDCWIANADGNAVWTVSNLDLLSMDTIKSTGNEYWVDPLVFGDVSVELVILLFDWIE